MLFCLVSVLQEQASKLGVSAATLAAKNAVANVERICQDSASPSRVPLLNSDQRVRAKLYLYQQNTTVRFDFKPSLCALIKPQTQAGSYSLRGSICLQKYKIYKKRSLGLSPEFSPSSDPLKSSKQGQATNCFSKSMLFTKGIISALFLG